jgi:hypothetical protein
MVMTAAALVMFLVVMVMAAATLVVLLVVMVMAAAAFVMFLVVMVMTAAALVMFLVVIMMAAAAIFPMFMMVMGRLPGSADSRSRIPGIDLRTALHRLGDPGQFRDQGIGIRRGQPQLLGSESDNGLLHLGMGVEFRLDLGSAVGAVQILDDVYLTGHGDTSLFRYMSKRSCVYFSILPHVPTCQGKIRKNMVIRQNSFCFGLGTLQSSGLTSTSTISGPTLRMQFQGMWKSHCRPQSPRKRQGPGTTMAQIFPSGTSTCTSQINPSRRPSLRQMTSLHCNWVNFMDTAHPSHRFASAYARRPAIRTKPLTFLSCKGKI